MAKFENLKFTSAVVATVASAGFIVWLASKNTQVTTLQPEIGIADVNGNGVTINRCFALNGEHPENVYTAQLINYRDGQHPDGQTALSFSKLSHAESDDGYGLGNMRYGSQPVPLAIGQLASLKTDIGNGKVKLIEGMYRNEEDGVETNCTVHATAATHIPGSIDGNAVRITVDRNDFGHVTGMEGPITYATDFRGGIVETAGEPLRHVDFE